MGFAIATLVFSAIAYSNLVNDVHSEIGITGLVVALVFGPLCVVAASDRDWTFVFYDGHVECGRLKLNRRVSYSDVAGLTMKEGHFAVITPSARIRVDLKDGSHLFVPGNPRNRRLNTDLYAWLNTKIGPA